MSAAAAGPRAPGAIPRRLVICPRIDNPENIGSMARTAAALGGFGMVIGNGSADPFSRKALKVSMGAFFSLPVFVTDTDAAPVAATLKRLGYRIAGAVADNTAVPLERYRPAERTALVLGNEADGISDEWLAVCDDKVVIPMAPGADSLNVAVSAGILLYALRP